MHLRAATASETCDVVVTNVTLLDPVTGIRTVSIGVREGRISAIGGPGTRTRWTGWTWWWAPAAR
jgi:urease subunit alpha